MNIRAVPSSLSGVIPIPGSKSHTIRACVFALLGNGVSVIKNPLTGEDCCSAARVIQQFGASVVFEKDRWIVTGVGSGLKIPAAPVDVGNSGSVLYFMTPVSSVAGGEITFTGDESIQTRPAAMMLNALRQVGVDGRFHRSGVDAPPFTVSGLFAGGNTVVTDGVLSQYVSGIMMAGSLVPGGVALRLTNPKETPYLTMTADWMKELGAEVSVSDDFTSITVKGAHCYPSFTKTIPADWEAAAFPLLAAVITDSRITIPDIDCSGSQGDMQIVQVMKDMGADVRLDPAHNTLSAFGCAAAKDGVGALHGITVNCSAIPDAIPALAVLACFASGETRLTDIGVCRLKETDRIDLMQRELRKLGAEVSSGDDWLLIRGCARCGESPLAAATRLTGTDVESCKDHRAAMSLACAGLAISNGTVIVHDAESCAVSFPGFFEKMKAAGAGFSECR